MAARSLRLQVAGVDVAGDEELVEGFAVEREAFGLVDDGWLPRDAEPGEVFEHGFDEVRAWSVVGRGLRCGGGGCRWRSRARWKACQKVAAWPRWRRPVGHGARRPM